MIDLDRDTALTGKVLDAMAARAKAAIHNIANQNTPGYKRYEVRFEAMLRDAVEKGKPIDDIEPVVVRDTSGMPGENNVSLLDELSMLEKVRLLQDVFSRRMGGTVSQLNRAIFGR